MNKRALINPFSRISDSNEKNKEGCYSSDCRGKECHLVACFIDQQPREHRGDERTGCD